MRTEIDGTVAFGPPRPKVTTDYTSFSTPDYLTGYARKILRDLVKVARMYNGRLLKLYRPAGEKRCPNCTDSITGEILLGNCRICRGTGKALAWEPAGDFWSLVDFGQKFRMASDNGAMENPGVREQVTILGAPLMKDQHLVIFVETKEVYKIYDSEPHIVAMRGEVISQIASVSRISPGFPEHGLIDW